MLVALWSLGPFSSVPDTRPDRTDPDTLPSIAAPTFKLVAGAKQPVAQLCGLVHNANTGIIDVFLSFSSSDSLTFSYRHHHRYGIKLLLAGQDTYNPKRRSHIIASSSVKHPQTCNQSGGGKALGANC